MQVLQVCSYALGVPVDMIAIADSDTVSTANNMVSSGSVSSELCCKVG